MSRRLMEDCFLNAIWTLWVHCYAIWTHECTTRLPTYGEWYLPWSHGHLYHCLPKWHHYLLKDTRRARCRAVWGPIYKLSPLELKTFREYIDKNIANRFIRHSRSPAGAPILFVKKKDDSLNLVVDHQGLDKVMVHNRYALPLVPALQEHLSGAMYFTNLDRHSAYNLVQICPGD